MRKTEDQTARHSDLWRVARKFVEVSILGEKRKHHRVGGGGHNKE